MTPLRCLPAIAFSVILLATAAAQTDDPTLPPVGQTEILKLTGKGVQIYTCKQAAAGPAWTFVAPEAKLEDAAGAVAGMHGAGPSWTLNDGSLVHGKLKAQQPSPESGSIPWLLLEAHDATGTLKDVAFIRRSDTHGGKAVADGCDAAHIGAESRVPYTATYSFYRPSTR